jgi:transposase
MTRPSDSPSQTEPGTTGDEAKAAALARHRTLHPHPELVTDPLFAADPFFDPRDLVQVKYEMLRRVRVDGVPVSTAVQAFGLSRPSFYDARQELAEGGLVGLLPHKKGPRRAHKMTPEVMAAIARMVAAEPGLTPTAIAARLAAELGVEVHRRTVIRALARPPKKA